MITLTQPTAAAQHTASTITNEPVRIAPDRFKVMGREGNPYIVIVRGDKASCNCQAGWKDRYCWHVEKVRRQVETEQDAANLELARRGNTAYKRLQDLKNLLAICDSGFYVRQQLTGELIAKQAELAECFAETKRRREAGTWRRPAEPRN